MPYEVADYWSEVGEQVRARGDSLFAGDDTPFFRYKRDCFIELLPSLGVSGRAVLEVGSGPGGNLDRLRELAPGRLAGVDVAPAMVELGRRRGHEVMQIDGRTLPFVDGEFEVVFCATVLQHNPCIETLISEMCRVTSDRVVLFEDVAPTHVRASEAYVLRAPSEYTTVARCSGLSLVEKDPLRVYASELMHRAVMALTDRRDRREGEPVRKVTKQMQASLLPITSRLDPFVPARRGLMKMVFSRRA